MGKNLPPVDETRVQCAPAVVNSSDHVIQQPSSPDNGQKQRIHANSDLSTSQQVPRHRDPPDIVLMDSNMSKMNGPDAIAEIRKLGYTFPIFGVTGDEDRESFMRAGADGVMMKPVRAAELVKTIHAALRKSLSTEAPKPPPTSGAMASRASLAGRRLVNEDMPSRLARQAYALASACPAGTTMRKKSTSRCRSRCATVSFQLILIQLR